MKKLKVGIAGYGVVGKRRHHFINLNPSMDVVAVCDQTFEKNYSLNDYASVRQKLPNLKKKWGPWNTIAAWYLWCDIDPVPFVY